MNVIDNILKVHLCLFLWSSIAHGTGIDNSRALFDKSSIFIMYSGEDDLMNKYHIDGVTWGSQYNSSLLFKSQQKYKNKSSNNRGNNTFFNSIDLALIQEGGKYVICGQKWNVKCDKEYWDLRRKNKKKLAELLANDIGILNRAVLDDNNKIAGVPWLARKGIVVPMARVENIGYKHWLMNKIDRILALKPNSIHFDESVMESSLLKLRKYFGLADYKNAAVQLGKANKKLSWSDFYQYKVDSNTKVFSELVSYIKKQADYPIVLSANVNPADTKQIPLINYLDYLAPEVSHKANKFKVPDSPLFIYKLAEAHDKEIVSTAFGSDWKVIKEGDHVMLASAWIAQAYASGQYMNFPLKAWVPGSSYQPKTNVYPRLSSWIKETSALFDDYESLHYQAVLINLDDLRDNKKKKLLLNYIVTLIKKGVLFKLVLDDGSKKPEILIDDIQNYESLVVLFHEFLSKEKNREINRLYRRNLVLRPSSDDMKNGIVKSSLSQVEIIGTGGVIGVPRVKHFKSKDLIVLHLLNRDYLKNQKRMSQKSPFRVKLRKKIFNYKHINTAILHQPELSERPYAGSVDITTKLSIQNVDDNLIITIPSLDLWGVVEFISL